MKKQKNTKGFTLVELIIVIAILAILAMIGLQIFNGVQDQAEQTKAEANAKMLANALNYFLALSKQTVATGTTANTAVTYVVNNTAAAGCLAIVQGTLLADVNNNALSGKADGTAEAGIKLPTFKNRGEVAAALANIQVTTGGVFIEKKNTGVNAGKWVVPSNTLTAYYTIADAYPDSSLGDTTALTTTP